MVDSFNADKPFDAFIQEQVADDLLPVKTDAQWTDNLIATTFLALGPKNVNEQNRVQFAADLADEQFDVTTRVFLGLPVACARCHDHKFDAIPQTDYYAWAGIFGNTTTYFGNPPSEFGAFSAVQQRQNSSLIRLPIEDVSPFDKQYSSTELASLKREMSETLEEVDISRRNRLSSDAGANAQRARILLGNRLAELSAKLSVVDGQGQPLSYCMGVQEKGSPKNQRLLVRGEIDQAGRIVERGLPQVLCATPLSIAPSDSGRLEFARWLRSHGSTAWSPSLMKSITSSTLTTPCCGAQTCDDWTPRRFAMPC